MKKLMILGAALLSAVTLTAKPHDDVVVKVATPMELNAAGVKLGRLVENPMLGSVIGPALIDACKDEKVDPKLTGGDIVSAKVKGKSLGAECAEIVKSVKLVGAINDAGIEIRAKAILMPGTIDKYVGDKFLTVDEFDKVSPNALSAGIQIDKAVGYKAADLSSLANDVLAIFKLDPSFLAIEGENGDMNVKLDVKALIDAAKKAEVEDSEFTEASFLPVIAKLETMAKEAQKLQETATVKKSMCEFKGFVPACPVKERFLATIPEAKASDKIITQQFCSLYGAVKTIFPAIAAEIEEDDVKSMLTMVMMQLPEEGKGGIGILATVSDKDTIDLLIRVSKDELKGYSGAFNAVMSIMMMQAQQGMGDMEIDEDDLDDEDEEDED